jgi:[NiFe] hydrogenase assembly HybE family chaperone
VAVSAPGAHEMTVRGDSAPGTPEDIGARLQVVFEGIHRHRMAGLPFLNPALRVEVIESPYRGAEWLGVLITPWLFNLMLLPRDSRDWQGMQQGSKKTWRFPSGDYDFVTGYEPDLGLYQSCVLLAFVGDVPDQESARAAAHKALRGLFEPHEPGSMLAAAARPAARVHQPLSRREFLRLGPFRRRDAAE